MEHISLTILLETGISDKSALFVPFRGSFIHLGFGCFFRIRDDVGVFPGTGHEHPSPIKSLGIPSVLEGASFVVIKYHRRVDDIGNRGIIEVVVGIGGEHRLAGLEKGLPFPKGIGPVIDGALGGPRLFPRAVFVFFVLF